MCSSRGLIHAFGSRERERPLRGRDYDITRYSTHTPVAPTPDSPIADRADLVGDKALSEVGRLSLGQLMWRKFLRSRLAVGGGLVLIVLYLITVVLGRIRGAL